MAVTVNFYNSFLTNLGNGTIDLDTQTVKIALMDTSHAFATSSSTWASVSANELSTGSGYTAGGTSCSGVTWTTSASSVSFDLSNPTWTASGGDIGPTENAVVYASTAADDGALICNISFGTSVTQVDGGTFTINVSSAGLFRLG